MTNAPAKEVRTGDVFIGVTGCRMFIDCVSIDEVNYHNEEGEKGQVSRRDLLDYCNKVEEVQPTRTPVEAHKASIRDSQDRFASQFKKG